MQRVNITTAKAQLSYLPKELKDHNQEVIIEKAGIPIAKLIKYSTSKNAYRTGAFIDKIQLTEDFDDLPQDLAKAFGMKD